jgi:hypothetical protein
MKGWLRSTSGASRSGKNKRRPTIQGVETYPLQGTTATASRRWPVSTQHSIPAIVPFIGLRFLCVSTKQVYSQDRRFVTNFRAVH